MRIISYPAIANFCTAHPNTKNSLDDWYQLVRKNNFSNFNELRKVFPSADVVKNNEGKSLTVFNIHGNEVRLIAAIHYNHNKLYIRHILTHKEYDKGKWKL